MSPASPKPPRAATPRPPATTRLADSATRGILRVLGDAQGTPLSTSEIADRHPEMASQRLVRDRLRELERGGIARASADDGTRGATELQWELTGPGHELYRLGVLISRIIGQAMDLPATARPEARDQIVQATLSAMSDPIVVQIGRVLAGATGPLDPTELEQLCAPIPRRTLYRRLSLLVDAQVVRRETTREVPRRTRYEIVERWRPAAGALLLAAWWELRHDRGEERGRSIDLAGLLAVSLPIVRLTPKLSGSLLWRIVAIDGTVTELPLEARDGRLVRDPAGGTPQAVVSASPRAWASALVTDQVGELAIEGDAPLALEVIASLRNAVLRYLK